MLTFDAYSHLSMGGPKMKRAIATGIAVARLLLTGSATRAQEPALASNFKDMVGIWHNVISATSKKHFLTVQGVWNLYDCARF